MLSVAARLVGRRAATRPLAARSNAALTKKIVCGGFTAHLRSPAAAAATSSSSALRCFSSAESFVSQPPQSISTEMAQGIADTTKFYCLYGISDQRFRALANEDLSIQARWARMMEIYLQTQAHVIAGLGYSPDDKGLMKYAQHLQECLSKLDITMRELLMDIRRDTWRSLVATTYKINPKEIPVLSIVDARNLMHKISSKMIEPDTLIMIQHKTAKIQHEEKQVEMAMKHAALQEVLVQVVYLGGEPSLVEHEGFGSGAEGYAKLQCAMTDHEGDPLISEYSSSAMIKILDAAGINFNDLVDEQESPGMANALPVPGTGVSH